MDYCTRYYAFESTIYGKDMIVQKRNSKMSHKEKGRTLYDLCWYPAASYSPGTCPSKYHPRKGA